MTLLGFPACGIRVLLCVGLCALWVDSVLGGFGFKCMCLVSKLEMLRAGQVMRCCGTFFDDVKFAPRS